jgi:hypothetical protein
MDPRIDIHELDDKVGQLIWETKSFKHYYYYYFFFYYITKMISDLRFRLVKMANIIYITALFVIFAMFSSIFINMLFLPFSENHSLPVQYILLVFEISLVLITIYVVRNIVETIPSPFDGVAGLVHHRVKEVNGGLVMGLIIFVFTPDIESRIRHFRDTLLAFF